MFDNFEDRISQVLVEHIPGSVSLRLGSSPTWFFCEIVNSQMVHPKDDKSTVWYVLKIQWQLCITDSEPLSNF